MVTQMVTVTVNAAEAAGISMPGAAGTGGTGGTGNAGGTSTTVASTATASPASELFLRSHPNCRQRLTLL